VKNSAITTFRQISLALAAVAAGLLLIASHSTAQSEQKSPGLFKSLPQKRGEPVKIASASLEFHDRSKAATFSGDVHIVQGELDLRSNTLVVFYEHEKGVAGSGKVASGNKQIRRMEARGSVVVTQNDQRAVSDRADFDMLANTVTLSGNVVVTRCEDVLRGQRLVVDMTTGVSRMEGAVSGMLSAKSKGGQC
jgi:lipopolysaccharide export system protein LptA